MPGTPRQGGWRLYAVIKTGGKQHTGDPVVFDHELLLTGEDGLRVGAPLVDGVSVNGTILAQDRHKKIRIIKFKRRKNYMRQTGHRQDYTEVRIDGIAG